MSNWSRREFLVRGASAAPLIVLPRELITLQRGTAADPWARAAEIVKRITPPRFAARDFNIMRFGAVGDGRAKSTEAIQRAIAACRAAGGGRVVVPEGRFLTGP
jgi:polygalacturonase